MTTLASETDDGGDGGRVRRSAHPKKKWTMSCIGELQTSGSATVIHDGND